MMYEGTVRNGVVVFPNQPPLAEGTRVRVEPVEPGQRQGSQSSGANGQRSVWDALEELAGTMQGLPADYSEKHDEYRRRRLGL